MKDYEACGIAAAIIDKNGVTQYEKFWGVRDLESQKELDGGNDLWTGFSDQILHCFSYYADGGAGDP